MRFPRFKRVLGECISARKWENVKAEIYGKVQLYNQMIDTAIDNGHGTPKIVHVYKLAPKTAGSKGRMMTLAEVAQMSVCAGSN